MGFEVYSVYKENLLFILSIEWYSENCMLKFGCDKISWSSNYVTKLWQ